MEKWMNRAAWIEVDLKKLDKNIKIILSKIAEGSRFLAVIKADAYGHGMKAVYEVMKANGISDYGVATLDEAAELRSYGDPSDRIVVFSLLQPVLADKVCEYNLTTLVQNLEYAKALSEEAAKRCMKAEVLGCVDTGMGRIGYQWDDPACAEELFEAAGYEGINMAGIFSHLSKEDEADKYWSRLQEQRFKEVIKALEDKGLSLPLNSLANSPASAHRKETHFGLCRPGGVLYGRYQGDPVTATPGIENILSVKANIVQLKEVPDGFSVSYGRSGRTARPSKIATLSLGFADGLMRAWGRGNGRVIVRGCYAPTIGNMCMDQFMVDVTDVPGVSTGDEVIVIGTDGKLTITCEELAEKCGTISTEINCAMSARLPRKYIK